ncbi:MAG: hypothetical protein HKN50_08790 [Gammaproteobacteria bacterium]|nr:hypothetical protein [Gammaproteobacteria bacterium]
MSARIHSLDEYIPEDDLILIPPGEYELSYQYHVTWLYMGRIPKVVVAFRIASLGEHFGKPIFAYYNVGKISGKPRKNGQFSVGWRSRFMWDYAMCFGKPIRKDRIPMVRFREHIVIGKLRTVTSNHEQKKYPESLQYSVVDELTGLMIP